MLDDPRPARNPERACDRPGCCAPGDSPARGVSRRSFIQTLGASAAASSLTAAADAAARRASGPGERPDEGPPILGPDPVPLTLRVNGAPVQATVDPAATLMDVLRIDHKLTGTKEICDRGACGGCSVLVDGRLVNSCMMLALDAEGAEITTIEGLGRGDTLDPVQESFIRHDALQCGYCTPGLVVAARALLNHNPKPTLDDIKRGLAGNICRCGTYTNIFNAVLDASGQKPIADPEGR